MFATYPQFYQLDETVLDSFITRVKMIVSFALGAVVGIILSLTGAGGGILAVPLLVFGVHLSVAQAGPIGLMAVGLAAALGAVMGLRQGIVRYKAAMVIALSGIVVSPLGLWLAHWLPNRPLTLIFAGVLLWVAYRNFTKQADANAGTAEGGEAQAGVAQMDMAARDVPCRLGRDNGRFVWTFRCAKAFVGTGVVTGFLSGLLGVGGGFVMVPALQRCSNLTIQPIVATSLGVIALVSASGVAASAWAGHVDWAVGLPFSGGALLGMLAGRLISPHLKGAQLSRGFGVLAGLVAVGMVAKVLL
jgi:uncharacterized membrane protein YfcA